MASEDQYFEKMRSTCEDANNAKNGIVSAIVKMIMVFKILVDLRNEFKTLNPNVYGTLLKASKSITSFYKFAKSLGLNMTLTQFRKYFMIAEGFMENFKEALADGKTMSDLVNSFGIKTIDVALEYAMTPEQAAAKKLKEKEAAEKKRKLQTEYRAEFEALQKEKKDKIMKTAEDKDEKAAEEEEAKDAEWMKEVQDVLARHDSLNSVTGEMTEMSVSDLVICSAYDAKVKMNDSMKIEMLRTEIRFYRYALSTKAMTHDFDYDEALAEAKANPDVAEPTGDTQDPWAMIDDDDE